VREIARLVADRTCGVGGAFGHGDIAVGTAVSYLTVRLEEFYWGSFYPNLATYRDRLEQQRCLRGG
jgi:glutathione S-transferase